MKELSFKAPVELPIANGATTPVPIGNGVVIWSTISNALLTWNGISWGVIHTGSIVTWKLITIDLGTASVYDKVVTIPIPGLTVGVPLVISQDTTPANGLMADEIEMDMVLATAGCFIADELTVVIKAIPGPIYGKRNFNLKIGQ